MQCIHRLVRLSAWRWPALARTLWLWPYAGCRVCLLVELPQASAARLDNAAILGLGHDRDGLELAYSLHCGCLHRADCRLAVRLDPQRQAGIAALIAESVSDRWRIVVTRGQEHLFDRYGYAPGVYEFDVQSERAILAALDARENAQLMAGLPPHHDGGNDGCTSGNDRSPCGHVAQPVHAAPSSSLPRAEHSAAAPRA